MNGCRLGVSGLKTEQRELASGLVCVWAVLQHWKQELALPNRVPLGKPLPLCLSLCLCQRQTGVLPSLFEVRIDTPCENAEPQSQCFFCLSLSWSQGQPTKLWTRRKKDTEALQASRPSIREAGRGAQCPGGWESHSPIQAPDLEPKTRRVVKKGYTSGPRKFWEL